MSIRFAALFLVPLLAASCIQMGNVDYSGIQSVGFANGMGDKVNRVKVGTTAFNNSSESVTVREISPKVTSAAMGILKGKVKRVEKLEVPTSPAKFSLLAQRSPSIDSTAFRDDSITAAKQRGLDAVWIIFPGVYSAYASRGPGTSGYEHRHDSFLGKTSDTVHFTAIAELIDVRSGKTLRTNGTGIVGFKQIETKEWEENWTDVSSARKQTVTEGITEVSRTALKFVLD